MDTFDHLLESVSQIVGHSAHLVTLDHFMGALSHSGIEISTLSHAELQALIEAFAHSQHVAGGHVLPLYADHPPTPVPAHHPDPPSTGGQTPHPSDTSTPWQRGRYDEGGSLPPHDQNDADDGMTG